MRFPGLGSPRIRIFSTENSLSIGGRKQGADLVRLLFMAVETVEDEYIKNGEQP